MLFWYVIGGGIVFLGLLIIPLRSRWFMGCGLALLGAVLGGASAFGAGWYYLTYYFVKPKPRHDMDFGGLETPLLCLLAMPVVGALLGLVLGLGCAYWLHDNEKGT